MRRDKRTCRYCTIQLYYWILNYSLTRYICVYDICLNYVIIVVIYIIEYMTENSLESFVSFFSGVFVWGIKIHIKKMQKKSLCFNHRICALICFRLWGFFTFLSLFLVLLILMKGWPLSKPQPQRLAWSQTSPHSWRASETLNLRDRKEIKDVCIWTFDNGCFCFMMFLEMKWGRWIKNYRCWTDEDTSPHLTNHTFSVGFV